ncbi:HAMP domain-containing sensor histidine kinase [Aureisphaera galaxeae]|uniref:sensor histidine kinase n=1 Tax=Aureisphaera galaxeae TaxID=1538023 RepID=UPI002350BFC6|nr:HAMP domain-containing sensor histidine kinase [Aureisphaera galaxeae]MDC8003849.1 HAMP domain-containing sensor histidine kinase [Aureisphaera galaxeae]
MRQMDMNFIHELGHLIHYINVDLYHIHDKLKSVDENEELLSILKSTIHNAEEMNKMFRVYREMLIPRTDKKEIFSINEIVNDVLDVLRAKIQREKIRINFEKSNPNLKVFGNPGKLLNVFLNLILNSLESVRIAKNKINEINISVLDFNKSIKITITDNGIGISKENIDKIFDITYSTKHTPGSGFGLAVAKFVVEDHFSGKINVSSEVNKSTTVTIIIPKSNEKN